MKGFSASCSAAEATFRCRQTAWWWRFLCKDLYHKEHRDHGECALACSSSTRVAAAMPCATLWLCCFLREVGMKHSQGFLALVNDAKTRVKEWEFTEVKRRL